MFYYVYRITNMVENKHYYGKRTSKNVPGEDLGIIYFSSSTNKQFIEDQKTNRINYKYKILKICATAAEATEYEIKLHAKFKVGSNDQFYNKVSQTSKKFDMSGVTPTAATREKLSKASK